MHLVVLHPLICTTGAVELVQIACSPCTSAAFKEAWKLFTRWPLFHYHQHVLAGMATSEDCILKASKASAADVNRMNLIDSLLNTRSVKVLAGISSYNYIRYITPRLKYLLPHAQCSAAVLLCSQASVKC